MQDAPVNFLSSYTTMHIERAALVFLLFSIFSSRLAYDVTSAVLPTANFGQPTLFGLVLHAFAAASVFFYATR